MLGWVIGASSVVYSGGTRILAGIYVSFEDNYGKTSNGWADGVRPGIKSSTSLVPVLRAQLHGLWRVPKFVGI